LAAAYSVEIEPIYLVFRLPRSWTCHFFPFFDTPRYLDPRVDLVMHFFGLVKMMILESSAEEVLRRD
jgi:hypothetical protein